MAATSRRSRVAAICMLVAFGLAGAPHAQASTWTVQVGTNSPALAQSLDPQPPSTVTAYCAAPLTDRSITVAWSNVSPATSYVVYRSTTSATDGFTAIATGVTSTSFTDTGLKKATYWYAVASVAGSPTWISAMSDPTSPHVIGAVQRCL